MSDETMTLWHAIECPFSMRARLVLHEKGLPYESRVVSLEDVGDEVRERNPKGEVPVLEADGSVIHETRIIAEYLEERFPEPSLWPRDPAERARARMLLDWIDTELIEPVKALEQAHAHGGLVGEPTRDAALQDSLVQVKAALHRLGALIHPEGFVLGGFGIVDVFLAPLVVGAQHIGVRRDEIPAATAQWIDRLRDRPSISAEAKRRLEALGLVDDGLA
jgi:RNA polymerase-associated protein